MRPEGAAPLEQPSSACMRQCVLRLPRTLPQKLHTMMIIETSLMDLATVALLRNIGFGTCALDRPQKGAVRAGAGVA